MKMKPNKKLTKISKPKASAKSSQRARSSRVASRDQVKKLLTKGLKQYKRTIKALEDK